LILLMHGTDMKTLNIVLQYNEVVLVWQFRILEHGTKSCVTGHHTMNVYVGARMHMCALTYTFLT
jgi:hypothetical protein